LGGGGKGWQARDLYPTAQRHGPQHGTKGCGAVLAARAMLAIHMEMYGTKGYGFVLLYNNIVIFGVVLRVYL
jgi:hypothetical protein